MKPVRFIFIGGFLGAGKTTLMANVAGRLARAGHRVGLITNDQAADLVDTERLREQTFGVKEVSAGCFCCNFNRLLASAEELLAEHQPDILLAEPVGSCADLSATVLQPLKKYCGDKFVLAPLSVLADPGRLVGAYETNEADDLLGHNVTYVFAKQLEEADLLVLSKVDSLSAAQREHLVAMLRQRFADRPVLEVSGLTGEGVDAWTQLMLSDSAAGRRVVEVDYDTYAAGEAELGWLNALVKLRARQRTDWAAYATALLERARELCAAQAAEIAHVKLFLQAPPHQASLTGSVVSTKSAPAVQGQVPPEALAATLIVNARVHTSPEALREIIRQALTAAGGEQVMATIQNIKHFRPARPTPTHRFDRVVQT